MEGVVDPDYRGDIKVGLINNVDEPFIIKNKYHIAQIILEKSHIPTITVVPSLSRTTRDKQGFGSIEHREQTTTPSLRPPHTAPGDNLSRDNIITPYNSDDEERHERRSIEPIHAIQADTTPPYQITLSPDPFDNTIQILISTRTSHPTLGLITKYDEPMQRLQLVDCKHGTPAAKIPKWRSTLKNGHITHTNGIIVKSINHLIEILTKAKTNKESDVSITFSIMEKTAMYLMLGVLQLHHDHLNVIAKHLQEIKQDTQLLRDTHDDNVARPFVKKLTRRKLKETPEWFKWNAAEFHQLDQYEQQDTFGPPSALPPNSNVLNIL